MGNLVEKGDEDTWSIIRNLAEKIDTSWKNTTDKQEELKASVSEYPDPLGPLAHRYTDPYARHYTSDSRTMGVPSLIGDITAPFRPDNLGTDQIFFQHWDLAYPEAEKYSAAYAALAKLATPYAQYCTPKLTSPYSAEDSHFQTVGALTYTQLYKPAEDYPSTSNTAMLMESPRHAIRKFWHNDVNGVGYKATDTTSGYYADKETYSAELYVVSEGKDHEDNEVICRNVTRLCMAAADGNGNLNNNKSSGTSITAKCPVDKDPVDVAKMYPTNGCHLSLFTLTERGWDQMKPIFNHKAETYPPPPIGCCSDVWFPRLGEELEIPDKLQSWFPFPIVQNKFVYSNPSKYVTHMKKVMRSEAIEYASETFGVNLNPHLADEAIDKFDGDLHVYSYKLELDSASGGKITRKIGVRISLLGFGKTDELAEDREGRKIKNSDNPDTHDWRWCVTGITVGIKGKVYPAIRKRWWDMMYYKTRCNYGYLYQDPLANNMYRAIGVTSDDWFRSKISMLYNENLAEDYKYSHAWLANRLLGLHQVTLGSCGMFGLECDPSDGSGKEYVLTGVNYGIYAGSEKRNMYSKGEETKNTPQFNETAYFGIPYFEQAMCAFNSHLTSISCTGSEGGSFNSKGGYCSKTGDGEPKWELETACADEILLPWNGGCGNDLQACDNENSNYLTFANTVNYLHTVVGMIQYHKLAEDSNNLAIGSYVQMQSTRQLDAITAHGRIQFDWLPSDKGKGSEIIKVNSTDSLEHIAPSSIIAHTVIYDLDCSVDFTALGAKNKSFLISVPVYAQDCLTITIQSEGMYRMMPMIASSDNDSTIVGGCCLPSGSHHPGVISTNFSILPDVNNIEALDNCSLDTVAPSVSAPTPFEYDENASLFQKIYYPLYNGKLDEMETSAYFTYGTCSGQSCGCNEYGWEAFTTHTVGESSLSCLTDIIAKTNSATAIGVEAGTELFEYGEINDVITIDKSAINRILRGTDGTNRDIYNGTLLIGVNSCVQSHFTKAGLISLCGCDVDKTTESSESCGNVAPDATKVPTTYNIRTDYEPYPIFAENGVKLTVTIKRSNNLDNTDNQPSLNNDCYADDPAVIDVDDNDDVEPSAWTIEHVPGVDPDDPDDPDHDKPGHGYSFWYVAGNYCSVRVANHIVGDEIYPKFIITIPPMAIADIEDSLDYSIRYTATSVGVGACKYNGDCQDNPLRWGFDSSFAFGAELTHSQYNCETANNNYSETKSTGTISKDVTITNISTAKFKFTYDSFETPPVSNVSVENDGVCFKNTGEYRNVTIRNRKTGTVRTEKMLVVQVYGRPKVVRAKVKSYLEKNSGDSIVPKKTVNKAEGTQGTPDINATCTPVSSSSSGSSAQLALPKTTSIRVKYDMKCDSDDCVVDSRHFVASTSWHTKETWNLCGGSGAADSASLDVEFETKIEESKGNVVGMPTTAK